MSTKGFSGGAGTGKTTSLLRELDAYLDANPLKPGQRILALTFMHGSRRRLADRLLKSKGRRQCECMTIDRFAWEICRRWRTRLRAVAGQLQLDLGAGDFDAMCEAAGRLLAAPEVARWVASRFPIVLLDEFQDCKAERVTIASALHGRVKLLIAADDFQNLNMTGESPAVTWLRGLGVCDELTVNHRTSDAALLRAASALRAGQALVAGAETSFMIRSVPSPTIAASYISKTLWPAAGRNVVILSPTRPEKSKWVRTITELVGTKKYGDKQEIGPVMIQWEASPEAVEIEAVAALGLDQAGAAINITAILGLGRGPVFSRLKRWAEHQRRMLGRHEFTADEVRSEIKRAIHHVRSFGTSAPASRRAMTIHQAKNREFEVVIILWPFEVAGDAVRLRRLLYNALTRAKRRAIIIVQDPKKDRLSAAPFGPAQNADKAPEDVPATAVEAGVPAVANAPLPAPSRLYFAYGSNMWLEQMKRRAPDHERIGRATLAGHRWIISTRGVANVVVSDADVVEGTLFRISKADEKSLDNWERVAEGAYGKHDRIVHCDGADHAGVLVYIDPITERGEPNREYIGRINNGLRDAGLSEDYVNKYIRPVIPERTDAATGT
jgi:hypothetical protein